MTEEGEFKSFIKVCILVFASLCYSYFIVSKIPKGKFRLLSLLPIFYYFTILPLNFFSIALTGTTTFLLTWLGNLKLLLFCFDQGPLSSTQPKSFASFISIASLPIKIKQNPSLKSSPPNIRKKKGDQSHHHDPKTNSVPFNSSSYLAIKIIIFALVVYIYCNHKELTHPKLLLVLYVYLALELILTTGAALARSLLGLELEPQFDKPYLSTSLQDFWGRRWNLMVASILRSTIHEPVLCIFTRILGRTWARIIGVFLTFFVSGLMHELIYYYMTRVDPTWEVTWFFVLHGICTSLEGLLKKVLAGKYQLHPWVSRSLTQGFVAVTGFWLFFPQFLRNGVEVRAMAEYGIFADFVMNNIRSSS